MNNINAVERKSVEVLKEAIEIQRSKGNDYNNAISSVVQADYYPRGVWSILDIVNAKYLRMVSVLETMEAGGKPNFESVEDSAIDAINYLSFLVAYARGEVEGQDPKKNIFNRPYDGNLALVPKAFGTEKEGPYTVSITAKVSQWDVYDSSMKKGQ